eukprot:TRINITY_DN123016_c0_g1_i1.p1 TRINITY_DN123016_c0_g1~~TRINITY_DN123016_c0_g1_i1.p1  ORF type:complete len:987 (+),score=247.09 TRINITY_DN123016_c0_g1_i1:142-3102(+)
MDDHIPLPHSSRSKWRHEGTLAGHICREEFDAYQEEFKRQLLELSEANQGRAEAEAKTSRACQLLDARVERSLRHAEELEARSNSVEVRLDAMGKVLESCRAATCGLKDKLQETAEHLSASIGASEEHCARRALDLCMRRQDRGLADELLRKMSELNEKLGGNMALLEDQVDSRLRELWARLEEHLRRPSEVGAAKEAVLAEMEAKLAQVRGDLRDLLGRSDALQAEQQGKLASLEGKLVGLSDGLRDATGANAVAIERGRKQFDDLLDVTSSQIAQLKQDVSDLRRELDTSQALDKKQGNEDLQRLQNDLRSRLSKVADIADQARDDAAMAVSSIADLQDEMRASCQEVVGLVQESRRESASTKATLRGAAETAAAKVKNELHDELEEVHELAKASQREATSGQDAAKRASEQVAVLSEAVAGAQQRVAELFGTVSRVQTSADAASRDAARCQEVARNAQQAVEAAEDMRQEMERSFRELRSDLKREVQAALGASCDAPSARVLDEQVSSLRNDFWQLARKLSEGLDGKDRQLQDLAARCDCLTMEMKKETAEVAVSAKQLHSQLELGCRHKLDDVTQTASSMSDSLAAVRSEMAAFRSEVSKQLLGANKLSQDLAKDCRQQLDELGRASEEAGQRAKDLEAQVRDQLSAPTRQQVQELIKRLLDERIQPLVEGIDNNMADCRTLSKTIGDIHVRCDKLRDRCDELSAGQQDLGRRTQTSVSQLADLRSEFKQCLGEMERKERLSNDEQRRIMQAVMTEAQSKLGLRLEQAERVVSEVGREGRLRSDRYDAEQRELRADLESQAHSFRRQLQQLADELYKQLHKSPLSVVGRPHLGDSSELQSRAISGSSSKQAVQADSPRGLRTFRSSAKEDLWRDLFATDSQQTPMETGAFGNSLFSGPGRERDQGQSDGRSESRSRDGCTWQEGRPRGWSSLDRSLSPSRRQPTAPHTLTPSAAVPEDRRSLQRPRGCAGDDFGGSRPTAAF